MHRMKILLSIVQELGGQLTDARMQQLLFLYCKELVKREEYYEFILLNGGPYSLQAEEDKNTLIHKKWLEKSKDWSLVSTGKRFAANLDFFEKIAIQDLKNKYSPLSDASLAQHVATYSVWARPEHDETVFYTIGYEGISPDVYINLLMQNNVTVLVDVRKNAFSQKYGFSKSELANILPRVGMEYLHMPELGIAPEKRQNLATDNDYEALFRDYEQTILPRQRTALDRLQTLLEEKKRIAITCFEANPCHCHRSRVAKTLKARENFPYRIEHIESCKYPNRLKQSAPKSS